MGAKLDITGKKYGRLTAVKFIASKPNGRYWLFSCDCGGEKIANCGHVRKGSPSSCGCLRKDTTRKLHSVDLRGKKFDRLFIIEEVEERNRYGRVLWECACDCGGSCQATSSSLLRGLKRSCGCIRKEMMSALGSSSKQKNPISKTSAYRADMRKKRRSRPEIAMAERISRMLAHAMRSLGEMKPGKTFSMLGYTPIELKLHIESKFRPGMNWGNRGEWQVDHIYPISRAKNLDDVIRLNQLENLQPLWSAENNKKKDKIISYI